MLILFQSVCCLGISLHSLVSSKLFVLCIFWHLTLWKNTLECGSLSGAKGIMECTCKEIFQTVLKSWKK
ncbi:hypothetical protein CLU79DRAFT_752224 [Phycomyces nitens]|nr:hypothetical protein CLU79DRAFT_752224 [Phycomyces nitens]